MRGIVDGLDSPHSLGGSLPGLYHDDSLVQDMCASFDEVLAPVVSTLDCLPAYLDPQTTPEDILTWLGGWVGLSLDGGQGQAEHRHLVRSAIELHRRRGTAEGLKAALEAQLAATVDIEDTGGTAWSPDPDHRLPGSAPATVRVAVAPEVGFELDAQRVDALVAALKPAHVIHQVTVTNQPE